MADDEIQPPNNVDLYRMAWHPDHFDAGGVTASAAFPRNDLEGPERYLSVDRGDLQDREEARNRARDRRDRVGAKGPHPDGKPTFVEAWQVELPCGVVRAYEDEVEDENKNKKKRKPFTVVPEPLAENVAHCGVRNVTGNRGNGYVNKLRRVLISMVSGKHLLLEAEPSRLGSQGAIED